MNQKSDESSTTIQNEPSVERERIDTGIELSPYQRLLNEALPELLNSNFQNKVRQSDFNNSAAQATESLPQLTICDKNSEASAAHDCMNAGVKPDPDNFHDNWKWSDTEVQSQGEQISLEILAGKSLKEIIGQLQDARLHDSLEGLLDKINSELAESGSDLKLTISSEKILRHEPDPDHYPRWTPSSTLTDLALTDSKGETLDSVSFETTNYRPGQPVPPVVNR